MVLYVDLENENDFVREQFDNIDFISLEKFLSKFEELIIKNKRLEKKIKELEDKINEKTL